MNLEQVRMRSLLIHDPDMAHITPDGKRLYTVIGNMMVCVQGKDFKKMSNAEIDRLVNELRLQHHIQTRIGKKR